MGDITVVEEAIKRLGSHKGVLGIVVINGDGIPIRTTLDNAVTVQYAALVSHFAAKARGVVKALARDHEDDLQFVRVRSKKHEILIAPQFDKDQEYQLIVIQAPTTD